MRASKHAMKSFTLEWLGADSANAGGAKGKKGRMEVLERLAHLKAGLSCGQKNDWPWFKEAWDQKMLAEHGGEWARVFAGWMENVLEDDRSNAFSLFVYSETLRVFKDSAALHLPGH